MRKLGRRHAQFKAFIATPAYDGRVYTDYCLSLADTIALSKDADKIVINGNRICEHPILTHVGIMGNGAFIEIARNTFVSMFLESDCTHLFFIDADLKWEPRAFVGLVAANKPIACGMYRRRQEPENYPAALAEEPETKGIWMVDGGFVLAKRVPTGFLCIRRDVIEEMVRDCEKGNFGLHMMKQTMDEKHPELPWLFHTKFDEEGRMIGEDFAFCDAYVQKYNEFIPIWADFDFVHGGFKCNFFNYLNGIAEGALQKVNREMHGNSGVMVIKESDHEMEPKLTVIEGGKA